MGMFDYFAPVPSIGCHRPGCTGKMVEWQGKYRGNCLFLWKQGELAPLDQRVSDDCKLDPECLSAIRLPENERIPAGWATCDRCEVRALFSIECITDAGGCWMETKVIGQTSAGSVIESGWIQCAKCLDAWPEVEGKEVYVCPSCKCIVFLRAEFLHAKSK